MALSLLLCFILYNILCSWYGILLIHVFYCLNAQSKFDTGTLSFKTVIKVQRERINALKNRFKGYKFNFRKNKFYQELAFFFSQTLLLF